MAVTHDRRRERVRELQAMEMTLARVAAAEPGWLRPSDESALRYALSLARVSAVPLALTPGCDVISIGRATDAFRRQLHDLLATVINGNRIRRADLPALSQKVRDLTRQEREDLLRLFAPRLTAEALDRSVRTRPFALVLGGGGGTAYVFVGALWELFEAELTPDLIAGASMGALIGGFRARQRDFPIEKIGKIVRELSWRKVFRLLDTQSRFGLPATLKLYLRAAVGEHFTVDGNVLRLKDMAIPMRVIVGGVSGISNPDRYAHLLDGLDSSRRFRGRTAEIALALAELASRPIKPISVGGDALTCEFDVVDAMGFSAAVPGVIHYDVLRDDPRMHELLTALLQREHVARLVDGGVADNLPARAAWDAVQEGAVVARDPFVLALDGFEPQLALGTNLFFYPLMRIAFETSKAGRRLAHLTVSFKEVLSPLAVVPTPEQMAWAIEHGRAQFAPHVPMIKKVLSPIPTNEGIAYR